jgi:hypothetical protein
MRPPFSSMYENRGLFRASIVVLGLLLVFTSAVKAQQLTAQLNGRISDSQGAAVPGAKITVSDAARGFSVSVTSDANGDYVVPLLQPADHYQITVDRSGFQQTVRKDVSLQVAQTAKIDVTLQVGEVTQSVTVTGAPPLLDTQTSSIGQVITGQTVQDLPLNGRSSFRLIALTPGVVFNQSAYGQFGDIAINSTFDTNFSINGGRAQSNEILIDGVPSSAGFFDQITTIPTVDDTQEFKVESNNLSAQYGRYAGGVINVSTKSGTDDVHGTAFEFTRNSAFEANQWFIKHAGAQIPAFKLNQFGGTVGAPLVLPKIYNGRNRTFYFLDYEGSRRIQGTPYTALVPTDLQKQGIFGSVNIYNPFTTTPVGAAENRQQFSYMGVANTIPPSMIDPVAAAIQKYFPEPNLTGVTGKNFTSSAPSIVNQDIFSTRLDQNVTKKYHLFGRYAYSNSALTQPNAFGNIADTEGAVGTTVLRNQSFAFDNIYTLTPSLVLSVDYGYARWFQSRQTLSYGFDITQLGLPASLASQVTVKMFPTILLGGGYVGTNNQSYLSNGNDSHALLASITKVAGKHTIVAGVDGRLHRINFFNVLASTGSYSFAIAQTQGPNAVVATGGNAYASFLIGAGSSGTIPIGSGVEMQDLYGGVYVEDNWRVSERLTLNLGVRYDGESPYVDRHNELNYFSSTVASPAANTSFPALKGGLQFAGVNGAPRYVYTRQHDNVAPRLGFSFNPNPGTVLRGGFGISYAPLEISNNAVGFSPSLGFGSTTAWDTSNNGGYNPANLLSNPFPQGLTKPTGSTLGAGTQLGQALSVWYNNPPTPRSYQWNLDVQQQLPGSVLFDIGYVGSRGLHLTGSYNENTLNPTYLSMGSALAKQVPNPFQPLVSIGTLSNATVTQQQLLLPYPQFLGITVENDPYGSSTYHSLQVKVVKSASNGLTLLASYTWSKLISNINASDSPIGTSDSTSIQNFYNLAGERSVSEINIPQSFVLNSVYELPFGRGKKIDGNANAIMNGFIGGWKLNAIWTEQSGLPLTFTATTTGIANGRPNLTGVSPIIQGKRTNAQRVNAWFNIAAFTTPPAYTFGDVRRTFTQVLGPGLQNLDSSLIKDTKFERVTMELRAEFFNVTNTPHFSQPDTGVQDASFGAISGTVASPPQREIQFGVKFNF